MGVFSQSRTLVMPTFVANSFAWAHSGGFNLDESAAVAETAYNIFPTAIPTATRVLLLRETYRGLLQIIAIGPQDSCAGTGALTMGGMGIDGATLSFLLF